MWKDNYAHKNLILNHQLIHLFDAPTKAWTKVETYRENGLFLVDSTRTNNLIKLINSLG